MRKWGHESLSLDIAREEGALLKQRISKAYTAQYGPGESSAAAVVSEVESAADLSRMMQELPAVEDLLETSAVTRLTDMGIEPFLLSSSLLGVLAQRLVRKICILRTNRVCRTHGHL